MSCLHLVSLPFEQIQAQLLPLLGKDDAILLMGDALLADISPQSVPVYGWQLTLSTRYKNSPIMSLVDTVELVQLTTQFDKTLSWHQT